MKLFRNLKLITRFNLFLLALLSLLFLLEGFMTHRDHQELIRNVALERARNIATQIIETRSYMASALRGEAEDNHALIPNSVASSVADRMVAERPYSVRLVSERYRNPKNRPDDYEAEELRKFAAMEESRESKSIVAAEGKPVFRYMRAQFVEPSCLECHGAYEEAPAFVQQLFPPDHPSYGYRLGEVIGAITVIVPMAGMYDELGVNMQGELIYHLATLFFVFVVLWLLVQRAVLKPIRLVSDSMTHVAATGNLTERIPAPESKDEVGGLIAGFNHMMNELEGAYLQRQESEARYRSLIELAPTAILTFLADGKIVISNRMAERLLGLPREKLLGASFFDFLEGEQPFQQTITDFLKTEKWNEAGKKRYGRVQNAGGELIDVEMVLTLASCFDKSPMFTVTLEKKGEKQ